MRDKSAFTAMRAHFSDKIRIDTLTPAWLPQTQLQAWLNNQYKVEKQKRSAAKLAETRTANSTQHLPPASHQGAGERPASKVHASKGKKKRQCHHEASSSGESSDEGTGAWCDDTGWDSD